jgi:hypothetical protein
MHLAFGYPPSPRLDERADGFVSVETEEFGSGHVPDVDVVKETKGVWFGSGDVRLLYIH